MEGIKIKFPIDNIIFDLKSLISKEYKHEYFCSERLLVYY